jgi:hypothetical protein
MVCPDPVEIASVGLNDPLFSKDKVSGGTPHMLQHTFASELVLKGTSRFGISVLSGYALSEQQRFTIASAPTPLASKSFSRLILAELIF